MPQFIRVLHNFGGKSTQERRVLPGLYEPGDPHLYGATQEMLADGHAVWFDPGMPAEEAPVEMPTLSELADSFAVVEVPAVEEENQLSDLTAFVVEPEASDVIPPDEDAEDKPSKRKHKSE
jgi:hypothetical protein